MEKQKSITIQIVFYSMYGHVYRLAEAIAEGARRVTDTNIALYRVSELVPEEILEKSGAKKAQDQFRHIPIAVVDQLPKADALIFGSPTRFGNMCAQMRNFLDQTGGLWVKGAFIGKVGSVFSSTGSQHGGQETTLTSMHTNLFHYGMIVVGVPYSAPELMDMKEITGGTPYGATTIADIDNDRKPSKNELAIARFQGEHVARITRAIKLGSE
jgi:NAD(P)H dehydrogenase (quinone)